MPRKVDPRRGEDGYDDWSPFTLSEAEEKALAELLGVESASSEMAYLRVAVTDIGDTYRRWRERGAAAFTRAQARKALEELLAADHIDATALARLNERALQCLHDSLLMMRPKPSGPGNSLTTALMEGRIGEATLRHATRNAVAALKATKGPEREGEIAWAVAELCRVYERLTGHTATLSNKGEHLAYRDAPQSPAGAFVHACMRLIDARLPPSRISHGMRLYIEGKSRG